METSFPRNEQFGFELDFQRMKRLSRWRREINLDIPKGNYEPVVKKTIEIDVRSFWLEWVRAIFFITFKRSYITDHLLPFAVGVSGFYANIQLLLRAATTLR